MAASFHDLPIELWLLIARYLTKSQLSELKSVNSFFLNCWMDLRWQEVHVDITARYSKTVNRYLERVVYVDEKDLSEFVLILNRGRDPFVTVRVKRLSIQLNSKKLASPSSSRMSFSTILKAIPLLPNITSLDIELIEHSTFHVTTFLRTITSSAIARMLQTLVLRGHMDAYASLGVSAHNTAFENLSTLALDLRLDDNPTTQALVGSSLTLEPFLRSLAPTLQTLNICTHSLTFDLSPLFVALLSQSDTPVLFSNLKSFSVSLHFDANFRSFPQSLRNFLLTYNNLQHLYLDLLSIRKYQDTEKCLGDLLADLLNPDCHYPSLQSLAIYPSTSQAGLSAVLTLIRRNARTLTSLKIFDRYLTVEEAKQLVDALTGNEVQVRVSTTTTKSTTKSTTKDEPKKLKSLYMAITHFTIHFLELLARNSPQLEELSLLVDRVIDQDLFCNLLYHRRYNPNTPCTQDILHTWKLHKLQILHNWSNKRDLVRAVAGAVPALSLGMKDDDDDCDDDF